MFYLDYIHQLDFFIITCICFLTGVYLLFWYKAAEPERYYGIAHLIPFCMASASFFACAEMDQAFLLALAKPLYLLSIFIIILLKPKTYKKTASFLVILISIVIWLFVGTYHINFDSYLEFINYILPGILSLMCLFVLRKHKWDSFNLGLLMLFLSSFFEFFSSQVSAQILGLVSQSAGFILILRFFYVKTIMKIDRKAEEVQNKLNNIEMVIRAETRKRTYEIEQTNQKLMNLSKTDALTKSLNKAATIDAIDHLISRKNGKEFAVLMFDIDDFSDLNESLGHIKADQCLKKLAVLAKSCIRDIDCLGRYGGDEFVIILPNIDLTGAMLISEKLRQKVSESETPHYTISIGIAVYPDDGTDSTELLQSADRGLYISKHKGKNAVTHAATEL